MNTGSETPRFPLIIIGERCQPMNNAYLDVVNPASGEVVARAAMGASYLRQPADQA